jgi:steroid delta-isomerase
MTVLPPPVEKEFPVSEQTTVSPALAASQASWKAVQARDKAGWLSLMADDIVIEDPIGVAITNEDGQGVRGKAAVEEFFDKNIATNNLRVECEETFPSSSELEVAHILTLHSAFDGGLTSHVRGVFCYKLNEAHQITNLRGYWNMDAMVFGQA